MKILALITARAGSKRVLGKNTRALAGKPLVVWSIDIAKKISQVCDILVSTDDDRIAQLCNKEGALVPWLRPRELATDTAGSVDVALHALNWYESEKGAIDGVLLLQPTSPFRTVETIERGISIFERSHYQSVVGVSPVASHPMMMFRVQSGHLAPFVQNNQLKLRSQDLEPLYEVNGSFYLITPKDLRQTHSFFGPKSVPLCIESPHETVDIDTEWDFKMAEMIAENCDAYRSN